MQITSLRETFRVKLQSEKIVLTMIAVLALIYRLLPINRGLGQDELFTTVQFIEVPSIFRTFFYNIAFNNHVGYSVMARLSESLFGRAEWVLRLPALLLGMGTLYIMYIFCQSLLGRNAALFATFLLAISPAHIEWSVEARGYSAMIFFTLLSSTLFFQLLRRPNRILEIVFIAASVAGIYVHLYAVFVTAVQILLILYLQFAHDPEGPWEALDRAALRRFRYDFLDIGILAFILYVPMALFLIRDVAGRGSSTFDSIFPWDVAQELAGSQWSLVVVLILGTALFGWFSLRRRYRLETSYFAWLIIFPLLVMWLVHPFDLYPRFFAYWLPYLLILFAAGIFRLFDLIWQERKVVNYAARLLGSCILLTVVFSWSTGWRNQVSDEGYREVSRAVVRNADPMAAYCAIGGSRSVWKYYIDKPIVNPQTLAEFQALRSQYPEVRCVYYAASWQDQGQNEIAQFLFHHASYSRVKELTWFVLKRNGSD